MPETKSGPNSVDEEYAQRAAAEHDLIQRDHREPYGHQFELEALECAVISASVTQP